MRIEPDPNLEEIAAIVVALAVFSKGSEEPESANLFRSRWRLAGLLGHAPPREMKLEEGALWSCSSWEGMV